MMFFYERYGNKFNKTKRSLCKNKIYKCDNNTYVTVLVNTSRLF